KAGDAAWAQARAAAWRVPGEACRGGEASAFPTAVQSAPRILGKADWITPAISDSGRRVAPVRGGRVTTRARATRSGGGVQRPVTVSRMGRLMKSWSGSLSPGSRWEMPTPLVRRQRAPASCGVRPETWSKARIQLRRARVRSSRALDGRGAKGEAEGSIRVRRMRAATDLPQPEGPRRMRMGYGVL